MGDVIEISTWPGNKNIFYKVTSSGLLFEVQSASSAAIGLAKKPGSQCDFWIMIGNDIHGQRTWIKKEEGTGKSCRTPNILSVAEYRQFWLSWRNGSIQLGRGNEKTPFLTYNYSLPDLNYVTFSAGGRDFPRTVNWRFELPPVLEKPIMKSITGGELQWVNASVEGHVPDEALIGGYEKENLYIIKAAHQGSITPGKFVPSQGTGYISWGGEAHSKREFKVLCGFDCTWVPTFDDRIPVGAVEGGYSERQREILYVGRVLYNGCLIPGKVQPSHRVCYIPFEGREVGHKKYEILISPDNNARSANRQFINHIDIDSPPESDNEEDDHEIDMFDDDVHDFGED